VLCSESQLRCTQNCTRISLGQRLDAGAEDGQICEPAGAVFPETLASLNDVDRQLILFSATSNLVAVRWLLALGANRFACDRNGTTCLHAACRSGAMSIVELFMGVDDDSSNAGASMFSAVDVVGWTPLHVAIFMGRCDLVEKLLKHGANLERRTLANQAAIDLCSDERTQSLLEAALRRDCGSVHGAMDTDRRLIEDIGGGLIVERISFGGHMAPPHDIRFEPFFVPRNPAVKEKLPSSNFKRLSFAIGRAIFARQAGCGLGFLVAMGCLRDYPIDIVGFFQGSDVDAKQVGVFLGEDFSLSKILRMEYMYSLGFAQCGVVACLHKAFSRIWAPTDLQKVDRILGSLAEVWWRQHDRALVTTPQPDMALGDATSPDDREPMGGDLKRAVRNAGVLHQLFFSTVMLHWSLHGPLPRSQRLDLQDWFEINRSIVGPGEDLPESLLAATFRQISAMKIGNLWVSCQDASQASPEESALATFAQIEGWSRLVGEGLPTLLGGHGAQGASAAECLRVSDMLSEATASSRRIAPEWVKDVAASPARRARAEVAWLSLCDSLLFFSAGPAADAAPFAFMHLAGAQLCGINAGKARLEIEGRSEEPPLGKATRGATRPLQLVLLMPDGRWQSYNLPRLVLEVSDRSNLEQWMKHFREGCAAPTATGGVSV